MSVSPDIRQFYKPVQPTVRQAADNVTYVEFLPAGILQNIIYCYWELKTTQPLREPFIYRVVADGCIDIFFEINTQQDSFVMGFCKRFTEFSLGQSFHYTGVRFLPTMFPQLFKINAAELSNRFRELHTVLPSVATFIKEYFHPHQSADEIKILFDDYFSGLVSNMRFDNDTRLYGAIDIILKNFGVVDVGQDLDTGISPRQLRRLFEFYIGDTAKTFAKVVRFQNILRAKPSSESLRQNKIFFNAGYYDQAHFIKEFKHLYGVTPGQAFGR